LGPESSAYLDRMLAPGTVVTLEYDDRREDQYGRDLAGVFLDGVLVNAEIARAGLGTAKVFDGNDRFYSQVLEAQAEAIASGRGLFSLAVECSVPAQVAAFERKAQGAQTTTPAPAELAAIDARQQELDVLLTQGAAIATTLGGDRNAFPFAALPDDIWASLDGQVKKALADLQVLSAANQGARAAEVQRQAQVQADEARRVAEAEAAARQEAAGRAQSSVPSPSRPSASKPSGPSGAGQSTSPAPAPAAPAPAPAAPVPDKYTGCRAYGSGGSSIDEKGRPYTKIDCVTKLPIG
jgi:micrococcal nuclease